MAELSVMARINMILSDPEKATMTLAQIVSEEIREFKASPEYAIMLEAESYYRNRSDVQRKTVDVANRSNTKIEHPILKKLVDQKANYLLSKPWTVDTKNSAYGEALTKVELLQGVGAVKVFPVWNGGGTVKIVFVNSDWGIPSSDLVNSVQTAVDPVQNQGVGDGIAPIGHVVTVEGVTGTTINVSFTLTFSGSATWSTVETSVKKAIQDYFDSLAKTWDEQENLVVRVSQIETKVLNVEGVIDITGTKINGGTQNISLASNAIPVLGVVTNGS